MSQYSSLIIFSQNVSDELCKLEFWIQKEKDVDKKVLIICLGGTISMVDSEDGLVVKKGAMQELMKKYYHFYDAEFVEKQGEGEWYITPESIYGKRTWYKFYEVDEPIDSSNMESNNYIQIATIIEENYDSYDSFLLIHGTDTMSYTASMLSFLLENLGKTVIITGSMIPLAHEDNDAYNNLICSLLIIGHFTIPEVTIFMNDRLIRGNRAKKIASEGLDAFDSPMVSPIIHFVEQQGALILNDKVIYNNQSDNMKFRAHKNLCNDVIVVQINPVLNLKQLKNSLSDPDLKGVILETYGSGNIPSNKPELLTILKDTVDRGVVIINISQCYYSSVSPIYQTGTVLKKIGVLFGGDMTMETVLSKIQYLLSKNLSIQEVKEQMGKSIRGELTTLEDVPEIIKSDAIKKKNEKEEKLKQEFSRRAQLAFPTKTDISEFDDDISILIQKLQQNNEEETKNPEYKM